MLRSEVDINKISPMMRQYMEIKKANEDKVIFFRLGDFYEMFFEDAINISRELELTLTGKNAGLDEKIPMCGIPHHAANIYIDKLVEKGYKIAIVEQMEDPAKAKGLVKRDIVRVVSKGTVIDDESLVYFENNYIGNIVDFNHSYGISYLDLSTGEIYATMIEHSNTQLVSEVVSKGIKEIIMKDNVDKAILSILKNQFKITVSVYNNVEELSQYNYVYEGVNDIRYIELVKHLLTYINDTQKRDLSHLQPLVIKENKNYLKMDIHTKRNLELTETLRLKQRNYSLIWLLDKTKTAMGSRMLKQMIENPLIDINEINRRYDVVETLLKEFILKDDLQKALFEVYDLERLSGRIAFGNANARDLLQLKTSLKVLPSIKEILTKINFDKNIETLDSLYELLERSIYENPPVTIKEGYLIKEGYNSSLDELKSLRSNGKDFVANFEREEREKTGIKTLKVGYNRVFGYYIEVSKGMTNLVKDEYGYERKQTLSNCERYISPILKEKEALILNAEEKIIEMEYDLFIEIRDKIKGYIPRIQKISKIISEIDVLQSFATVTEENNYIRPILNNDNIVKIENDRHPVVEKVLSTEYVANDIIMDENTNVLLITGPNMAGKSTYMRQTALIVLMAQTGSFVPADSANICIVDRIFTRVGASDDLASGQSTFMVEMTEVANILRNATPKSLIILDEIGRGTSTFDGLSIAWAVVEYIANTKYLGAKTLFATHYHELTELEGTLDGVNNYCIAVKENGDDIVFLRKIVKGGADKSYGIQVAKLAGVPDVVLNRAKELVVDLSDADISQKAKDIAQYSKKLDKMNDKYRKVNDLEVKQMSLFDTVKDDDIVTDIMNLDISNMTPIDALNTLYKLQGKAKNRW